MQPEMLPATPLQQWTYEAIVQNALEAIWADESHESVMQVLRQHSQDPVKALAQATKLVLPDISKQPCAPTAFWIPVVADLITLATASRTFYADINTATLAIDRLINDSQHQEN